MDLLMEIESVLVIRTCSTFSIEGKIDLGLPRHFKNQDFFIDTFPFITCWTASNKLKTSTIIPTLVHYAESKRVGVGLLSTG